MPLVRFTLCSIVIPTANINITANIIILTIIDKGVNLPSSLINTADCVANTEKNANHIVGMVDINILTINLSKKETNFFTFVITALLFFVN